MLGGDKFETQPVMMLALECRSAIYLSKFSFTTAGLFSLVTPTAPGASVTPATADDEEAGSPGIIAGMGIDARSWMDSRI